MLSDEERMAIEHLKNYPINWLIENVNESAIKIVLNLIEKKSKEIEELKEDRKSYAEEYIHNNPWLYKQLNENYILRVESEQKERKAWIKGTNDADELCNKKWEDKIKANIEEEKECGSVDGTNEMIIEVLQSLLEKE